MTEIAILIPTLEKRRVKFEMLKADLEEQIRSNRLTGKVEIISNSDSGQKSIGQKRNELAAEAVRRRAKYIDYVDDDDRVSYHFVKTIYDKTRSNPDCVELKGIYTVNGRDPQKFIHSIAYNYYFEEGRVFYRPPNHLNCIKTDLVKDILFPENNFGEDTSWAMQLVATKRLKTMEPINDVIYFYDYIPHK